MIAALIDKQDSFEIVRDQIAAILAIEVANQKALAIADEQDPALWDFLVFKERANPWELYLNPPEDGVEITLPIVNVWYDASTFDKSKSNAFERQHSDSTFNIDMYGRGLAQDTDEGHTPGDLDAALAVQRVVKLVRNILMAGEYAYLGLRGLVGERWPQSVRILQPEIERAVAPQIVGARMVFNVTFNEFSPQVVPETLETLFATVKSKEDGEVVIEAEYIYPAP